MPDSAVPSAPAAALPVVGSPRRAVNATARLELLVLALVIAAQLLPLLLLPYIPTQDGPSHQALAYALRVYDRPEGAPLRQYLMRNDEALPNWFVFFLQAKVLAFLSVNAAEKVLVAAYVVLLPLGLRYALRGVDAGAGFLAALGLPFTYNFLFGMGFLNFCWSLAAFLFAFGFYLRRRERFRARHVLPLALLTVWVYFCHPVSLVMLVLAVAALGACQVLGDVRVVNGTAALASGGPSGGLDGGRSGGPSGRPAGGLGEVAGVWWRVARERLVLPLASLAPALVLLAMFVGRRLDRPTSHLTFVVKAKQLLALYSLVSFDRRLLLVACGLAAVIATLAGLLLWRRRSEGSLRPRAEDALLAVAALFALVYLAAPSELAGGGFVNHRLALFPPLAFLLWLGGARWGSRTRLAAQLLGAALALAMLAMLWARWSEIDRYLDEYVAVADRIEDGSTVLPLGFAPAGVAVGPDGERRQLAFRLWPFVHALGYVAGRRPIVDLGLYEAGEDYFPLRYRPELDPYRHLSIGPVGMEEVPPRVDIPGYERRGGRVDYVLLWQPRVAPSTHAGVDELYRQLERGFERIHVSSAGNAELWRRAQRPR
ncbi:MAG TPA: hypothetical protein VFS60_10665 [Thermoanaerobaculia bacterium]|nr:hypothetical protein [Thermoanaerobaculia bacterium]